MDYAADLLGRPAAAPANSPATDYASDLLRGSSKPPKSAAKATAQSSSLVDTGALKETLAETPEHLTRALRGFWQGATDIPVGLVQLASKFGPDKIDESVAEYIRQREADYQASRGDYSSRADIGRATGNVVASLPVGSGAAAATLPGRMVQGAKVGGMLGAATPVNPDAESFALNKTLQVGAGAVLGGLSVPVVEGAVRAAGATVNALARVLRGAPNRLTNKATQDAVQSTLTVELQKQGVNWADLSQQARDAMVLETQRALKSGGAVDPAVIGRIADFQKLKIEPTRGQVTRDPLQFATERNLGKMEIGKPISDRLNEQNTRLIGVLDEARAATGSPARDAYETGAKVMGALRTEDEAARKAVKAAYAAARDKVGANAEVPMQPIAQRLGEVIDEVGAENIPAAVSSRLKDFGLLEGKQTKLFTLAEAEKLRKLIGNNMPGQRTPVDAALAPLKQSIDDAVNSLSGRGDQIGAEAAGAIATARDVAKQRFEKIESIPLLSDMLRRKAIASEDVVGTYILRGSVDEVKTLMGALPPGARRDVQASVIDWIKSKAVNGSGDAATFTQAGFNKALDDIGARNLDAIFPGTAQGGQKMIEQLRRLGRVAANVQKAPVSSGVNYSSSATAIIDMLDKVGRLPLVGAIAGKPGDIVRASQVQKSLTPGGAANAPQPFLTIDQIDNLARSAGVVSPGIAAAVPLTLSRP